MARRLGRGRVAQHREAAAAGGARRGAAVVETFRGRVGEGLAAVLVFVFLLAFLRVFLLGIGLTDRAGGDDQEAAGGVLNFLLST